jgi:phosphoesterase RecJ-like protein
MTKELEDNRFDAIIERIKVGKRFMVVSHVNPEGDAVGSLLGLTLALKSMGKDVTPFLQDPIPKIMKFLPGADTVVHTLDGCEPFDAAFAVDCGKLDRLGSRFVEFEGRGPIINIDHHITNDLFGELNVIDAGASATGEVLYDFCKAASIEITRDIAINLYVAIHTDTGGFRYSSSTADSFMKAGELVRSGADPWDISTRVYENYPAKKYKLLAKVLATLDISSVAGSDANIATLVVTLDMLKETDTGADLADGFVNYARSIENVEVGILFRELDAGKFKVSFRSKGVVDVAKVSESFGGGGHSHAAGCTVNGELEDIRERVVGAVVQAMSAAGSV